MRVDAHEELPCDNIKMYDAFSKLRQCMSCRLNANESIQKLMYSLSKVYKLQTSLRWHQPVSWHSGWRKCAFWLWTTTSNLQMTFCNLCTRFWVMLSMRVYIWSLSPLYDKTNLENDFFLVFTWQEWALFHPLNHDGKNASNASQMLTWLNTTNSKKIYFTFLYKLIHVYLQNILINLHIHTLMYWLQDIYAQRCTIYQMNTARMQEASTQQYSTHPQSLTAIAIYFKSSTKTTCVFPIH